MALNIRPACASDACDIGDLAQQFAIYLRSLGDQTDFKLTAEAYLRDGFGEQPAFHGIVAEDDNRVIGYLLYHFGYDSDEAARILHIVDLYVDAGRRKQGVGYILMKVAAGIAREAGANDMIWSVYHANVLATAFYEKLGARRVDDVFFMKLRAE